MRKFSVLLFVSLLMTSMAGAAVAAFVTKTVSGTYLGDSAIQIYPKVNKTSFVIGQDYELFTITYDNESKCWTEYFDAGGVSNSGCITDPWNDWYTDAEITLGADLSSALALYTVCPDRRNTHWDHVLSWFGFGWVGVESRYDLSVLFAWWNEAFQGSEQSYVDFWILGFVGGTCPLSGPADEEFVELNFGNLTVADDPGTDVLEIWNCEGATFDQGYAVEVTVDPPYAGIWYQVEEDDDGACQDFKDENADFACNQKGNGNLVTSRIDDDVDPSIPLDFHQSNSGASMVISDSEVTTNPSYAMVHADVFQPGTCATPFSCDHDGNIETDEATCFDSGFGGGPYEGGYYGNAFDACENTFDNTSEGFWAELNENGGMISPNRNPKNTANNNWAMYVELADPYCQGEITVETDGVDYVATENPPVCSAVSRSFNGIVDGGDYFMDGGTVAGHVDFTPTSNCTAVFVCDSYDGTTCEVAPD